VRKPSKKPPEPERVRLLESKLYRAQAANAALRRRVKELENHPWREELAEVLKSWRFETKEQLDQGLRAMIDGLRLLRLESEHARLAAPGIGQNGSAG
jgi:hypothetical protein